MARISNFTGTRFLSTPSPEGFGIRFSVADDKSVFVTVIFDESKEGGAGVLHGGAIAAVLDEAMGTAAFEAVKAAYTATMTCDYKAMIPLFEEVLIRARVTKSEGKKIYVESEAMLKDGTVAVIATGLFIASDKLQMIVDANPHTSENE